MPILFVSCPTCGRKGRITPLQIGKLLKCRACGDDFLAEAEGSESDLVQAESRAIGGQDDLEGGAADQLLDDDAQWYYKSWGDVVGPVNYAEIKRQVHSGLIDSETPAKKGIDAEWVLAGSLQGLIPNQQFAQGGDVPAMPPEHQKQGTKETSARANMKERNKAGTAPSWVPAKGPKRDWIIRGVFIAVLSIPCFVMLNASWKAKAAIAKRNADDQAEKKREYDAVQEGLRDSREAFKREFHLIKSQPGTELTDREKQEIQNWLNVQKRAKELGWPIK